MVIAAATNMRPRIAMKAKPTDLRSLVPAIGSKSRSPRAAAGFLLERVSAENARRDHRLDIRRKWASES